MLLVDILVPFFHLRYRLLLLGCELVFSVKADIFALLQNKLVLLLDLRCLTRYGLVVKLPDFCREPLVFLRLIKAICQTQFIQTFKLLRNAVQLVIGFMAAEQLRFVLCDTCLFLRDVVELDVHTFPLITLVLEITQNQVPCVVV